MVLSGLWVPSGHSGTWGAFMVRAFRLGIGVSGIQGIVCGLVVAVFASATAQASLTVSPLPNTPDASPYTQISLLGVAPAAIDSVVVRGWASGRHAGVLRSYSDNSGASYVLSTPFTAGERASVTVTYSVGKSSKTVSQSFQIARPEPATPRVPLFYTDPKAGRYFVSDPSIRPARVRVVEKPRGKVGPGYVLLTPTSISKTKIRGQGGPLIIDLDGNPVWAQPIPAGQISTDLEVQRYRGRPVLTWWQGFFTLPGYGSGGVGEIYDSSYREIAQVKAGNGYQIDLHELALLPDSSALITAYSPIEANLSSVKGPTKGQMIDTLIQQVDVPTGLVKFEWHPYGHVPIRNTYKKLSSPFEPYHLNSVTKARNGDILVSMRNTSALYLIDHKTGTIKWTLGGKHSSFRLGKGVRFVTQHNARFVNGKDNLINVFDDGHASSEIIRLNFKSHTATLVRRYGHSKVRISSQGSTQLLTAGNVFIGWGSAPFFSEYSSTGQLLYNAEVVNGESYRAFRASWTGKPRYRPAIALKNKATTSQIFVSWNGATRVDHWRVLSGPSSTALRPLVTVKKRGFETAISIGRPRNRFLAVVALDNRKKIIGRSEVVAQSSKSAT